MVVIYVAGILVGSLALASAHSYFEKKLRGRGGQQQSSSSSSSGSTQQQPQKQIPPPDNVTAVKPSTWHAQVFRVVKKAVRK